MTDEEIDAALTRVEACLGAERPMDAVADLQNILAVRPNHPMALCGIGRVCIQLGDNTAALAALDLAIQLAPDLLEARNARGVALQNLGRLADAEDEFRRVVEALPDHPGALLNLASLLAAKGEFDPAQGLFERILALYPDDATAGYNLGLLKLVRGDLANGWKGFDLRHKASNVGLAAVRSDRPRWTGAANPDASLLISAEQGLGDNIQFSRYATLAAARVGTVTLEAPSALTDMFGQIRGVDRVVSSKGPLPEHDLHIPIMSLPGIFGTDIDSVPWNGPYIRAAPERVDHWRGRLGSDGRRLTVGLVWAGNPSHKRDRDRSMTLAEMAPLLDVEGIDFCALQIGPAAAQLDDPLYKRRIRRVFRAERPLTEVAAVIAGLDLLIGVDTSLVHLAGAMARPVWTFVSYVPDWRWMLSRRDSPWYPTMRVFRQPQAGDWAPAVAEGAAALAKFSAPACG